MSDFGTGVSLEFCEMSKNIFSYKTPPVAASEVFSLISKHNSAERAENIYQELKEKNFNEVITIPVSVIKHLLYLSLKSLKQNL